MAPHIHQAIALRRRLPSLLHDTHGSHTVYTATSAAQCYLDNDICRNRYHYDRQQTRYRRLFQTAV